MPRERSKRCIFCEGAGPFNEEHCFDQRLDKWLLEPGDTLTTIRGEADFGPPREWTKEGHSKPNMVTRAVCKACNGGWVRSLGDECEPAIAPMLWGEDQLLYPETQQTFARWAAKIATTHDSSFFPEGRQIDVEWCHRIYHAGDALPDRMLVWIGRYVGRRLLGCWTHRLRPFIRAGMEVSGPLGFCSVVVVGEILFLIVGLKEDKDFPVAERATEGRLLRIWPHSESLERGPLRQIWGDDTIEGLCARQVWGGEGPRSRLLLLSS